MGTRGSVGFIYKDKEYLSYNNFDSYPSVLGVDVLSFIAKINEENGWDKFKEYASILKDIKEEDITHEIIEKYKKYADLNVSTKSYSDPYCLFRSIQGCEWMEELYKGNLQHFTLDNEFIKDSLYCEYAYIINLDTMKLEFYDGYQKEPQLSNRFGTKSGKYYPCRLVGVFSLSNTDKNIIEKMDSICESHKDDPSVSMYFRKPKLKALSKL